MGAPIGNQYAKGNKGGTGRRPAWQERADGEIAKKIFFQDYDIEELDKIAEKLRTRKGKISMREVMIIKALSGNEKVLTAIWGKVAADVVEHGGGIPVKNILSQEANADPNKSDTAGKDDVEPLDHRGQGRPTGHVSAEQNPAALPPGSDT